EDKRRTAVAGHERRGRVNFGNHRRNTQIRYSAISVSGTIAFAAISPGQRNAAPMAAATTMPRAATLIQLMHSTWVRLALRNLAFWGPTSLFYPPPPPPTKSAVPLPVFDTAQHPRPIRYGHIGAALR